MTFGGMYQLVKVQVMDVENGPQVIFPAGTIVKNVPLNELEQQLGDIAKYQVVEATFLDEESKRKYGLSGGMGAIKAASEVAGIGREFIGAQPERMMTLGLFKEIPQPPLQASQ